MSLLTRRSRALLCADQTFNHRTLRVHVANLRRKLAPYGVEIAVVVHLGYRLLRAESRAPK